MSTLPSPSNEDFPLRFQIADGLDGSGKQNTVYYQPNTNTSTKSFILFCFKVVHIVNSCGKELWKNECPNSPFSQRPNLLLAATENHAIFANLWKISSIPKQIKLRTKVSILPMINIYLSMLLDQYLMVKWQVFSQEQEVRVANYVLQSRKN
ncbi:hypothetical protein LOD99_11040 [Oopsacas minuta]|uniref:Uncharacterized protein n=1 Tax=Oopsacas minuta TaxID=111878 RepID=A0AAV7KE85_9METZ|nr:hypothetical protein LOD99_11040 [Oopsacas minuta]